MKTDGLGERAAARPCVSERPLVSIGVPAYNGAPYLAEALESALAQEYSPLELLICDDGSSDETEAICRRFAAADPRVRYVRNPVNVGAVENFQRVLSLANGTYFTWLGQDDLFIDTDYLSTVISFLEHAPDVVGCMGPFTFYDLEGAGPGVTVTFPEIGPDRPWHQARREFFAWPQRQLYLALYGTFRRAELLKLPFTRRTYHGRPNADCWEMPPFTVLVGRGRMVALPTARRGYRSNLTSDGFSISRRTSPFDFLVLGIWMRAILVRNAWRLPAPLSERIDLLRLTLGNFLRANIRRPVDYRYLADMYAREHRLLREAAATRWGVIVELRESIATSRASLRARGIDPDLIVYQTGAEAAAEATTDAHDILDDWLPTGLETRAMGLFQRLLDPFRPPSEELVVSVHVAKQQIGELRAVCAERLALIERLDAELRLLREGLPSLPSGAAPR